MKERARGKRPVFRNWHKYLLKLVLVLNLASCQRGLPLSNETTEPPSHPKKIEAKREEILIGETIEVFIMEDPSFNALYKVRENGDIIFPKLGRVFVSGITIEQAQNKIKDALQASQLKKATVIVDRVNKLETTKSFEETPKVLVFITGKVNRPGQHLIAVTTKDYVYAYEAVLIAGGLAPFADEKHAYILRRNAQGPKNKIPLDLRAIRQGIAADKPLVEGDMICVPERRFAL